MGDWSAYVNLPKSIQAVSADTLKEVARKYFIESNCTTGWFVPEVLNSLSASLDNMAAPNYYRDPAIFGELHNTESTDELASPQTTSSAKSIVDFSSHMQRAQIGDIELIAIDLPIDNVVSFVGSIAAGDSLSPADAPMLATLTAAMLDQGTANQDRFQIAEKIDQLGADLDFSSGDQSLNFSGKFLRADAGSFLQILADQLRNPAFEAEVLETLKSRQKANLLQAIDNPDYRAGALLSRILYPQDHVNYSTPINELKADIESTTVEDLDAFHAAHYGNSSMQLIFTGDIDFEQLKAAVGNAFDGWEGGSDYPKLNTLPNENAVVAERIYIEDKTSVAARFGFNTGLQRTDDDYLPFMVGNYILGGSFHSRLMTEVRKNRGLTYDIRARHQGDILTQGNWSLSASFSPSVVNEGLQVARKVVQQWFDDGVSEEEVAAAIETLTGSYIVGLSTTGSVAGQVHSFMQRGFDPKYIDEYPLLLRQLTAEEVNHAIRQYFDPSLVTEVVAGSFAQAPNASAKADENLAITVRLDAPDAGWRVQIESIHRTSENIVVYSQLSRDPDNMSTRVISTVADTVKIDLSHSNLPVCHYVSGKTWDWGDTGEYTFIDSPEINHPFLETSDLLFELEK
jgi:zinc protease